MSLLPLLFFSYLLQYLDKTTLGYASILGVIPDLVSNAIPNHQRRLIDA